MKVRYQADADLSELILRSSFDAPPAIDFQTAPAAALTGLPDPEVLALAAREDRVLVSHDQSTMPAHFRRFMSDQRSPGVLIVPQSFEIHEAADELLLIWESKRCQRVAQQDLVFGALTCLRNCRVPQTASDGV